MKSKIYTLAGILLCIVALSCTTGPEPIHFGNDQCAFCKMTIMDRKFGSELITEKGRIFKFDDINCMVHYMDEQKILPETQTRLYVIDYSNPGVLIDAKAATYLQSDNLKTPMAAQTAAFSGQDAATPYINEWQAQRMIWGDVYDFFLKN